MKEYTVHVMCSNHMHEVRKKKKTRTNGSSAISQIKNRTTKLKKNNTRPRQNVRAHPAHFDSAC